jgi:hypothetical protein
MRLVPDAAPFEAPVGTKIVAIIDRMDFRIGDDKARDRTINHVAGLARA